MDLAAFLLRALERGLHPVARGMVDQRADQRSVLARIADLEARIGLDQAMGEIGADRAMDDQAPERGAALSRRADGGKHDRPDRHVEIGRGGDDHRIVAAELEDRPAEPRGDLGPDDRAHAGRAGGRDDRHALGGNERFADRHADDENPQSFRCAVANRAGGARADLLGRQRGKRRLFRRLPDHRIAGQEPARRSTPRRRPES